MIKYSGDVRRDFEKASAYIIRQEERIQDYQQRNKSLLDSLNRAQDASKRLKEAHASALAEKDAVIAALKNEIAHLKAVASHDSTNTGIPTASTPINKKKLIPNSRRSTGRKKGGQPGHKQYVMTAFADSEVTETVHHELEGGDLICDKCGGSLIDTGETVCKDEFDVIVKTVKRRNEYHIYECADCGGRVRLKIDKAHKEKNQYGSGAQALALSLMATGNVAVNKVRTLISGLTDGDMMMSDGYIISLYAKAAKALSGFLADLKAAMVQRDILYWDETVIMVWTARACMRFYGDETISYFTAHLHKDLDSLLEDGVLAALTSDTVVMHDHNKVNYNPQFFFENIECNQHLQRDLQKVTDDNPGHLWSGKVKDLISETIKDRKDAIAQGEVSFPAGYVGEFHRKLDEYLSEGAEESLKIFHPDEQTFEKTLLTRIEEYRANYFLWVEDFRMPTTDNLSERGLRCIKSHMKISGQYENEKAAQNYAAVKTYIETCRKNNINEIQALTRLCEGNPYTVAEIVT